MLREFRLTSGILLLDNFFGFNPQGLDAYLNGRVLPCARPWCKTALREHDSILVYGELYGGHYPHPDVAAVAGVARFSVSGTPYPWLGLDVALATLKTAPRPISPLT